MRRLVFALASFAVLTLASSARAEEPAPAPEIVHDGLYVSFAFGPTYVDSAITTTGSTLKDVSHGSTDTTQSTTISGMALAGQLLVGGTVSPGLVVGGGSMGNVIVSPKRSWAGDSRTVHAYSLAIVGPFVDYALDPRGGLHFQALLGLADEVENTEGSTGHALLGAGFGLGVGYDAYVADHWALGVVIRTQLAHVSKSNEAGTVSSSPGNPDLIGTDVAESQTIWTGGMLFAVTYH
jgi:hypothetical protein